MEKSVEVIGGHIQQNQTKIWVTGFMNVKYRLHNIAVKIFPKVGLLAQWTWGPGSIPGLVSEKKRIISLIFIPGVDF